ncbi:DUF3108 domain-containing protein [Phreatobacter stygius]|uniref:DUF3108 domain-containing protein n=1 Tax=Phreatobacter stygius TaxID=1940610 RepID=UPI001476F682|nr:DUF3108 domain-containing protein [Phreatobacter stygius]
MSRSSLLAGIAAFAAIASPAAAIEAVSGRYEIMIGGLQVGVAGFEGRISNDSYETSVSVRLSGVSRLIASGRGSATASGRIAGGRAVPANYALTLNTTQQNEAIRMAMSGGAVRTFSAEPAKPEAPDQVPLTASHRQGVLDPLAAALFVVAGSGPTVSAEACARTFPVFDGRQRYDLAFSYSRTEELKVPGYSGPAVVCNARYRPIAGHRPAQTQGMEQNRDMQIWLAPVAGTRALVPARIMIRTPVGMAQIEPTKLELGSPTSTASINR